MKFGKSFLKPRLFCTNTKTLPIGSNKFIKDNVTNVTPKILSFVGTNLHLKSHHPLSLIRQNIVNYYYEKFKTRAGNPVFSVYDMLNPAVTIKDNFDSLLVPQDHVSRNKSDCYYINNDYMLRAHMTAHQAGLIGMGLNSFLMVGDVYRRDEIDSSHFPVFHQLDAVKLFTPEELFISEDDGQHELAVLETGFKTPEKQSCYTLSASQVTELKLKTAVEGMCKHLFGENIKMQWVSAYFPFTHPSWELEIMLNDKWVEVLGCGIIQQPILQQAGVGDRIGWAFGVGLERLAMILYQIPDIRLFWSKDTGFLNQFLNKSPTDKITYKSISQFPQCRNDISFWVPSEGFCHNDFYELARDVAGDLLEQVLLTDTFTNPKTGLTSHCYQMIYRHMERTLTKEEVNKVHSSVEKTASQMLNVKIR